MMLLLTGNMCVFGMRIQDDIYQLSVLPFQLLVCITNSYSIVFSLFDFV